MDQNSTPSFSDYTLTTLSSAFKDINVISFNKVFLENLNLTELTGEAGSGKTQMCYHIIMQAIKPKTIGGLGRNCLYITTVQPISDTRFKQFFNCECDALNEKEKKNSLSRFHYLHLSPSEFEKFFSIDVDNYIIANKINFLIIDSITGIADTQFINDQNEINFKERSRFIKQYIKIFKNLILKYNLFFFVTNNVSANFSGTGNDEQKPCLGRLWENGLNTRLYLRKDTDMSGNCIRYIKVQFSNYLFMKETRFEFNQNGITFFNN